MWGCEGVRVGEDGEWDVRMGGCEEGDNMWSEYRGEKSV